MHFLPLEVHVMSSAPHGCQPTTDEIHDAPAPVALLDVRDRECRHLRPSEPAAEEHCQNRPFVEALGRAGIRRV
jgi:hypothetical protein